MNKQTKINKIFEYVSVLTGAVWLGAYVTRMAVSYQLFDIKMNLKPYVNSQNLNGILTTIAPAINITFIVYLLFIFSFTIYLATSKLNLKLNGWLFVIAIIVYVTLPFEIYLMTFDYRIIQSVYFSGSLNDNQLLNLIKNRFTELNGFPIIIILSYFVNVFFLLFKPLTAKNVTK